MLNKLHWSSRWGRIGNYCGTLHLKLVDDSQKVFAKVLSVAQGNRAHVEIKDGAFHDAYIAASMEDGRRLAQEFFGLN